MPYTYRKNERIRKNSEFISIMKGKRLSVDGLSLFYAPNDKGGFRVGVSVGKKIAGAVARNRLRRQIRDCVGRMLKDHSYGYDLVFVARQGLLSSDHGQILTTVSALLKRSILPSQSAVNPGIHQ